MAGPTASVHGLRLSLAAYLVCVAVATALGTGVMMLFRPALAHSVREMFGLEARPQALANSFYMVRVAPIFEEHCVGCHGKDRQRAKLRLDSYAAALRGGKDGPAIQPGNLGNSQLFERMTLPISDDRVMPPSSKPPVPANDVTIVKLWIAAGASGVQPPSQFKNAPPPVARITFPEFDPVAVEKARAGQSALVRELQRRYPGVIQYESRTSANLEVNASLVGPSFDDAGLRQLMPLSDRIVWMDLSGTAVSDASADVLSAMKNLRTLHLDHVSVKDSTLLALRSLHTLRCLTIIGINVKAESVLALRTKGVNVYDGSAD